MRGFKEEINLKKERTKELRRLEYINSKSDDNSSDELQAFYDELEKLQQLRDEFKDKSKKESEKAGKYFEEIEKIISDNTANFSNLFSDYCR